MTARARRSAPRLPPARDLHVVPTPAPPAWAIEAAKPSAPTIRRDFDTKRERIWHPHDRRFVERVYENGSHTYRAWERADPFSYGVTCDEVTYGRIDTRRAPSDCTREADKLGWSPVEREARALIHDLCPETIAEDGHRVYDGPGYVVLLCRPETRYAEIQKRRAP